MPKMFGFSRRRMKLGRLKVQLGDPPQAPRSPLRSTKRHDHSNEEKEVLPSGSGRDELNRHCSSGAFGNPENWTALATEGNKPTPRSHHAAAIVGSKMVIVGGDSGHKLLDDTMILSLDRLTWATAIPRVYLSGNGVMLKIPACKGHTLVSWGKSVLLIGGKTDPVSERVSVWSFDIETECWSRIEVKGDIPVARSGHTVTRAGSVLILFGGEDVKGKKLNDLHMFDLKSFTWLPLHYKGTKPSPRTNHVATLYDDKTLFVFGGQSKSKFLSDIYSLDFETMVWSRIKIRGHHPSPRSGCCGALCGTKWYITGGGSKRKRHAETLVFDVTSLEWTVSITSPSTSVTTSKGFTMLPVHHKDKTFLVAFGGFKKEASNQVEILFLTKNEHSLSWRSAPDTVLLSYEDYSSNTKELGTHIKTGASPTSTEPMARHSLASTTEQQVPGRKSLSEDPNSISTSISLSKQLHSERNHSLAVKMQKSLEDEKLNSNDHLDNSSSQAIEHKIKRQETAGQMDIAGILASTDEIPFEPESSFPSQKQGDHNPISDTLHILPTETDGRSVLTNPNNMYQLYETRIATLTRKNILLEEQLRAAVSGREAVEKSLSSAIRSRQDVERKLAEAVKESELLKEKLTGMELAQEEANSLSNIVHSDNVRLEHDVAFLKAILDDTQKELHSTRGVIAGERARAFQLQVEVFHLKQRLQSVDNRAPTPRKPYNV